MSATANPARAVAPSIPLLLAPLTRGLAEAERPAFLARLEQMAAQRYREWAEQAPAHASVLLACAESEQEIAARAARLFPMNTAQNTLQITFSIVNPGEVAKAHRHNMAAIRFVVQGKGAYTAVDGEKFFMEEGDLILTPNWPWHDHHNESQDPIIWLDGLDGPLIQSLNVLFFEDAERPEQEITRKTGESLARLGFARAPKQEDPYRRGVPFRYSFKDTYKALKAMGPADRDPYDGILLRYINPATGGYTYPTMSCEVQLLNAKESTESHRHTSSALYHVVKGQGRTKVGDGYLEWRKGDTFVVPLCNGMPMRISATMKRFCFL